MCEHTVHAHTSIRTHASSCVRCSVLCCSVSLCVAVCCSALQCVVLQCCVPHVCAMKVSLQCQLALGTSMHAHTRMCISMSFAEYRLFHRTLLQKRPIILRSLLHVGTPYMQSQFASSTCVHTAQHTTTHCNTLHHAATHCNALQLTLGTCVHTAQHTATHCNTLHRAATHGNTLELTLRTCVHTLQHTATHAATHAATHCNSPCEHVCTHTGARHTRRHLIASISIHCNTLQHPPTHCTSNCNPARDTLPQGGCSWRCRWKWRRVVLQWGCSVLRWKWK